MSALGRAVLSALLAVQAPPLRVTVGGGEVDGRRLAPGFAEFAVYRCGGKDAGRIGTLREQLRLVTANADTAWRRITRSEVEGVVTMDTTVLERGTLAGRWSRGHIGSVTTGYDVYGSRVIWHAEGVGAGPQSYDSTFSEPAFLAGTEDLLLEAAARSWAPGATASLPLVDLAGGSQVYSLIRVEVPVRVTRGSGDTLVVMVGETRYTLSPRGRVTSWAAPLGRAECFRRFVRVTP
ncbi:MAG TPA: hypothetical protein VFK78_12210 [Gemmatimonadales bacterium]|nr:hypothetical protein [Gemmatimonadales bacterium]